MTKYISVKIALLVCLLFSCRCTKGQLPTNSLVYFKKGTQIYNYDPLSPVSATNPSVNSIRVAGEDRGGLAISPVLGSGNTTLTFYTVNISKGVYEYYDPASGVWVNTGHRNGSPFAANIAAGNGYIFNLVGGKGQVYRYDGSGPDVLIATVPGFTGAPYDLVTDCEGNWYIFNQKGTNPFLKKYSAFGTLLRTWTYNNPRKISVGAGAGFAIIDTILYTDDTGSGGGMVQYGLGKNTVTVLGTIKDERFFGADDFATSPWVKPAVRINALPGNKLCRGKEPVTFTAAPINGGAAPVYQWIVNGISTGVSTPTYTYLPADGDEVSCMMTSNAPCAVPNVVNSDKIKMAVYEAIPAPTVISPLYYCQWIVAPPLTAQASAAGNNLYWYTVPEGNTASFSAPIPSTRDPGTLTYYVAEENRNCKSPRTAVTVIVFPEEAISDLTFGHPATYGGKEGFIRFKTKNAHEVYQVLYYKNREVQPALVLTSDAAGYISISELGDGIYTGITITNTSGCSSFYKDPVLLAYCNLDSVPMPNSFTPNGDNINDIFYVRGNGFIVKKFYIYDRLGDLVFSRENFSPNDPQYGWNGVMNNKIISDAAGFAYIIEISCPASNTPSLKKGTILMIK